MTVRDLIQILRPEEVASVLGISKISLLYDLNEIEMLAIRNFMNKKDHEHQILKDQIASIKFQIHNLNEKIRRCQTKTERKNINCQINACSTEINSLNRKLSVPKKKPQNRMKRPKRSLNKWAKIITVPMK